MGDGFKDVSPRYGHGLTALLAIMSMACESGQGVVEILQRGQGLNASGVTCAFVLNDNDADVARTFCAPGLVGSLCRSDDPQISDGLTCDEAASNPLQSAITYADQNLKPRIKLDAGEFEIREAQTIVNNMRAGIYIPSNLWISGWMPDLAGEPQTKIIPSPSLPCAEKPCLHVGVYIAGHRYDPYVSATNVGLDKILIDGKLVSSDPRDAMMDVALLVGKSQGAMRFYWIHATGTRSSSMIFGRPDKFQQVPTDPTQAMMFLFEGASASNPNIINALHVHDSGMDGIVVVGRNVSVENCLVENGPGQFANGIGTFSNTENLVIQNNTIRDFTVGIGLDGSFQAYCDPSIPSNPCLTETLEEYNNRNTAGGIGRSAGYNRWITVLSNNISVPALHCPPAGDQGCRGVAAWRAEASWIWGNQITGTGSSSYSYGIHLNEANDFRVWENQVSSVQTGIRLVSGGYGKNHSDGARLGSSYNGIGVGNLNQASWNTFTNVQAGVSLGKTGDGRIRSNTIWNNQIPSCDYSGSDGGVDRQYCSGNSQSSCNFPDPYGYCQAAGP